MSLLTVSMIFKEIGVRLHYDTLLRTKNGSLYNIEKFEASNGKLSQCINVTGDDDKDKAIIEFLTNYMRASEHRKKTKKSISAYIKKLQTTCIKQEKLEFDETNTLILTESSQINVELGGDKDLYYAIEDFKYRTNKYNIDRVIDFTLKCMITQQSPYRVNEEYEFPSGTIHTWNKGCNQLRILAILYDETIEYIQHKYSGYDIEKVIELNHTLVNEIKECKEINETIREEFINRIEEFITYYRKSITDSNDERKIDNTQMSDSLQAAVRLITSSKDVWNLFAESKKNEIFEVLYQNPDILCKVLERSSL